jgi:DNA (cytosine-5)-methyltransferase 1
MWVVLRSRVGESRGAMKSGRRRRLGGEVFNFISVFAGGGGLCLGLEAAGLRPLLASDVEPTAEATFKLNRSSVPFALADVRRLTREDILGRIGVAAVHLVAAGLPCQGFSTLGDQVSSDARNQLFAALLRIVEWLQPPCVLIENVNYLRTQYGGRFEGLIRASLESRGYEVHVTVLNAADFGVPQVRKRVFFFATRFAGFRWPDATHGDGRLTCRTVADAIADLVDVPHGGAPNHLILDHGEKVLERYKLIPEGGRMPPPSQLPVHIRRRNFGNTYKRLAGSKPSLTLVPGNNAFPVHPTLHRSLTPREAARLQTFPDYYIFSGNRSEQCRLVGNAVPPMLSQALGTAIREHLAEGQPLRQSAQPLHRPVMPNLVTAGPQPKHKAVSFFTGLGGLMLGFVNAGFGILSSYDRKRIVEKNLALNYPSLPHYSLDITSMSADDVRAHTGDTPVDVVFGGSPCQGFSIFGQRRFVKTKGHAIDQDERNELTIKFVELATALKPKMIVLENVKGFMSARRGDSSYLIQVTRRLAKAGYDWDHQVVNCASYGVPQTRERFLLVAWRPGLLWRWPERKHHAEPKPWQRPYVTVGDVISDLMDPGTQNSEYSHVPMEHKEKVVERYKLIPEGGRLPEEALSEELRKGYRTAAVRNFSHVYKRLAMDAPATTMVPGHNAFPIHPRLHRALTVREAARIQTFPDELRIVGSRQQQCMLVGNAVPVLLAEVLAQCVSKTLQGAYGSPGYKADVYELAAQ